MSLSIPGIRAVTGDGHDGVYFSPATKVFRLPHNGRPREVPGAFRDVSSVAVARDGSLFVLDAGRLLRIVGHGSARTVAGDGSSVASRDDPHFCSLPVPSAAAKVPVSAA